MDSSALFGQSEFIRSLRRSAGSLERFSVEESSRWHRIGIASRRQRRQRQQARYARLRAGRTSIAYNALTVDTKSISIDREHSFGPLSSWRLAFHNRAVQSRACAMVGGCTREATRAKRREELARSAPADRSPAGFSLTRDKFTSRCFTTSSRTARREQWTVSEK